MPSDKHPGPLWRRYYNVYDADGVLLARAFSEEFAARIVEAVNASAPTIRQRIKRMLDDIQGEPVVAADGGLQTPTPAGGSADAATRKDAAGAPSGSSVFCSAQPPAGSSVRCTDEPAKHAPSSWGLQEVADPDTEELLYVEPDHPLYQRHCEQTAPSPDAGDGPSELAAIGGLTSSCAQGSPEREHGIKLKAYRAGRASRDGTITGLIEELAKARATLESELAALRGRLYRVRLELLIRRLAERRAELLARCVCERDQVSHDRFYERAMRAERRLKRFRAIPPELRPGEKDDGKVTP